MSAASPAGRASDEDHSSPSWADEAWSSEDERQSPTAQPVRIKLKRSRSRAPEADTEAEGDVTRASTQYDSAAEVDMSPSPVPSQRTDVTAAAVRAAVGALPRARPLKQLRAKTLPAALEALIVGLKKRDTYLFFHEPVNADEVPGYREVITHPMDLGTMEKRLHAGHYKTMDMFQHDFMLVTQNAQTFNPPTSIYHTAARRLETWGLRAIAREAMSVVDEDELPSRASPQPEGRRGRRKRSAHERAMGDSLIEAEPNAEYLSRRMMRIGSARSTTWSLQGVDTKDPEELVFRRTLAYAGVGQHQLTGKSACSACAQAKAKPRLAPPLSLLHDGAAEKSGEADGDVAPLVYRDDGALESSELADAREFLAQQVYNQPVLESLQHLPLSLSVPAPTNGGAPPEPTLVFPPAQVGRPDAMLASTLAAPAAPSTNVSHTFADTPVPEAQRPQPFAVASQPGPAGLGASGPWSTLHTWPAPAPPALQESGLRLNRRERELEQELDEHNWTFGRPHLQRFLAQEDVGLYASMPAWAARRADQPQLQSYAAVAGPHLTHLLREHLRAMPYRALGLPRTAQFVPRASLQQLPVALQVSMQGAQETERLIETVYGSVDGMAYARSLAAFVGGASEGLPHEPEADEKPAPKMPRRTCPTASEALPLAEHVQWRVLYPLTGGLLGLLDDAGAALHQAPADPLLELLDDKDGLVSSALCTM
ncbi:hypothetical protein MCAP1_000932 [Malassezia caprae]|uniref:Bromo domain-containing protein n=1 Tax=Malassezia caprae TaxID=1381934 RepID=A0AAF0E740_9BASI|nr:hypothetical protein MCAP1_000932 [Malassezia caprae]